MRLAPAFTAVLAAACLSAFGARPAAAQAADPTIGIDPPQTPGVAPPSSRFT